MESTTAQLNGARIICSGQPEVWLVFHGTRHYIVNPAVYDALFSNTEGLVTMEDVSYIQRGADLNEGTCLARAEGDVSIHLVTGFPDTEVRKHLIPSYESFLSFGFDESKVHSVPSLIMGAIPLGREIRSAFD